MTLREQSHILVFILPWVPLDSSSFTHVIGFLYDGWGRKRDKVSKGDKERCWETLKLVSCSSQPLPFFTHPPCPDCQKSLEMPVRRPLCSSSLGSGQGWKTLFSHHPRGKCIWEYQELSKGNNKWVIGEANVILLWWPHFHSLNDCCTLGQTPASSSVAENRLPLGNSL